MIRQANAGDQTELIALAEATGLFQPHESEELNGMLSAYFAGDLGDEHCWIADDEDGLVGAAYYAREAMADQVWNLYFIGIHPDRQGEGRGTALLRSVERALTARGVRLLLVETSGLGSFDLTRRFYRKNGYEEEARIRDFYRPGDDKIVFRKAIAS